MSNLLEILKLKEKTVKIEFTFEDITKLVGLLHTLNNDKELEKILNDKKLYSSYLAIIVNLLIIVFDDNILKLKNKGFIY